LFDHRVSSGGMVCVCMRWAHESSAFYLQKLFVFSLRRTFALISKHFVPINYVNAEELRKSDSKMQILNEDLF